MKRRLHIKVELELHSITCPGVWLCPSGYVEVTLKSLGYFFKAGPMEPKFPLLCHELFVMEGYFKSIDSFGQLEKTLSAENIEIAIFQNGRRLAYYRGKLGNILQSLSPYNACASHKVNAPLLMIPSRNFPGVLAPKIEMSGRASIQNPDRNRHSDLHRQTEIIIPTQSRRRDEINHEDRHNKFYEFKRQRPVCHASKRSKPQLVPSDFHSCTHQFHRDTRTPAYVLAQKIRYTNQNESQSDSKNSSNSTSRASYEYLQSRHYERGTSDNQDTNNESDEEQDDDHSISCHICQSYKDIFSSSR